MRLTIDIDGRGWWAWAAYYSLRDSGLFRRVELWRTRRGHHIVAYGGLTWQEVDILRRIYGDDPVRTMIDGVKAGPQPRQVLWSRKMGYEKELVEVWEK
jgi:hypothetical protein